MGKTVRKVWNTVTSVIVVLTVLLAVALVGVRLVGLRVFAVLSGSMEPTYHTGSLIYVKSVDYKELQPGDVITFMLDEDTIATHRIVEVVPDETEPETLRFRTKGDANDAVDGGLVHYKNVVGTYLHGPLLPKNPHICDYLLSHALERKYGVSALEALDDTQEKEANQAIYHRFVKQQP